MADWLTEKQRSFNMSRIRSTGTSPEQRLKGLLRMLFPRRWIREHPNLPGKPDFYLPGLKLAVFADGCFWHGCPEHGRTPEDNRTYWAPKLARNQERDREADQKLLSQGIQPLRVWEHDLKGDMEGAAEKLETIVRAPASPPQRGSRGFLPQR